MLGEEIRDRRTRLGMTIKDLAAQAGIDRGWLSKIEKDQLEGERRDSTVGAILRTLDRLEEETGAGDHAGASVVGDPGDDLIEFTIEGNFGVRAVVRGPVRDMAQLKEAVTSLVREMKSAPESD